MAKINLLPWREALRKQQQQNFLTALVLALITTCLVFFLVYLWIETQKTDQNLRNQYLETEIATVKSQIKEIDTIEAKKQNLRKKIEVIESLQASRSEIVHVFDELRSIIPEGIYLTKFTQLGDKLTIEGRSTTDSEVSALMDAIDASEWLALDGTGLKTIDARERTEKERYSEFIILAKQLTQKDKQEKGDEAEVKQENNPTQDDKQ